MGLNTEYLLRCIEALEKAYTLIRESQEGTVEYEMYRNSLVKGFEMTLEQTGKLHRKKLIPYFSGKKKVDTLTFKDLFWYAFKYSLIKDEGCVERWMKYRDNRNNTAQDYGRAFAEETLSLIEDFLKDVKNLKAVIENG